MSYTIDLVSPFQMRLCNDIKENRCLVFSRDLVYYIIHKYKRNWRPLLHKNYTIHERSPLTHSVRQAVDLLLKEMDSVYAYNYDLLVAPSGDHGLSEFVDVSRSVFDKFSELEAKSINILFDILVFVARLSVECDLRGVRDAPHMAVVLINLFLMPLERDVFVLFHQHALDIIDICSKRPGEVPAQPRDF